LGYGRPIKRMTATEEKGRKSQATSDTQPRVRPELVADLAVDVT
jgi:hypothetical protein